MDSLLLSILLSLFFISISSAADYQCASRVKERATSLGSQIQEACKATRFPERCEAFLQGSGHVPPNPSPVQIIQSAITVSSENLKTAHSMVKSILDSSAGNENRTMVANNCLDLLPNSAYRISLTAKALSLGRMKDARAWMSAALAFQYDCWSSLKYGNDTSLVNTTMAFMNSSLIVATSNSLSMLTSYDVFGNDTRSWRPPTTERDGFWDPSAVGKPIVGFNGGVPKDLKPNATVCCKDCKDGCYKTVQEAVDAAPDNDSSRRFVIWIPEGVYEGTVRVPLQKKNVVLLGDGMGKTVITGSLHVGLPGISTSNTATVGVSGDGFMASGLTIRNTAGADAHQAVAFRSESDLSVIENCEFLGNQDTLYAHALRQFYKSCRIEGNVDFIFGNSAAIFQDCLILVRPRVVDPGAGEKNAVTAHGRSDPAQTTGLVFRNCVVNGTEEYMKLYYANPTVHQNFLGRPWKEYSRTVFIKCELEVLIAPEGWLPWSGDFALATLYYGEFHNRGLGGNLSSRVQWSSQIPGKYVGAYSVDNFIQGNDWIPHS